MTISFFVFEVFLLNYLYTYVLEEGNNSKSDLSEYIPIIVIALILIVLALYIFFGVFSTLKSRKKQLEELEKEIENGVDEQNLVEINASVYKKECFVKTYGTKIPESIKEFYITFLPFSGETMRYSVSEELYLSVDEGVSGTIALINDNFFDFYFKK